MSTEASDNAVLNSHTLEEIDQWLERYPADQKQSAVLAALRAAQHQNKGFLTVEIMDAVAEKLEMPKIAVYEVASFYSMYETEPVGKHCVAIGESTPDGKIFLKVEEECLAGCDGGPMMQVDHVYHMKLTPEKVDEVLDALD